MKENGICNVSDLKVGSMYYGSGLWRNLWVYLGRNSKKEFIYYFIGNAMSFLRDPTAEKIITDINLLGKNVYTITKQNKKLKSVTFLANDTSDNYISKDYAILIRENPIVTNCELFTLEYLDFISREYNKYF